MSHFTTNIYESTDRNRKFKKYDALIRTFPNSTLITTQTYLPSDLAIIYSWIGTTANSNKSLYKANMKSYKKLIIDSQEKASCHTMAIDNSLFVYKDQSYIHNYLRFSIDGVFANTGYYLDREVDRSRWAAIQKNLDIKLKPWRKTGNHVLICMQRSNGFSFNYENGAEEWLTNTIISISKVTDRPIVIRNHPGDRRLLNYVKNCIKNISSRGIRNSYRVKNRITISSHRRIEDDMQNAWCCVTYNSSPSVVSAIEGIPVFVLDPEPQKSQAYPICNIDINCIENPIMPDHRQEWVEKLAMSHFSYDDIENSLLYKETAKFFEEKNARI